MPEEYLTVAEAQARLAISKSKMADLIDEEVLHVISNPLDKRSKLISAAEVDALLASGELSRRRKENYQYMSVRIARRNDNLLYVEEVNRNGVFTSAGAINDPDTELIRYLTALNASDGGGWHIAQQFSWEQGKSYYRGSGRTDCAELLLERPAD